MQQMMKLLHWDDAGLSRSGTEEASLYFQAGTFSTSLIFIFTKSSKVKFCTLLGWMSSTIMTYTPQVVPDMNEITTVRLN